MRPGSLAVLHFFFQRAKIDHELIVVHSRLDNALAKQQQTIAKINYPMHFGILFALQSFHIPGSPASFTANSRSLSLSLSLFLLFFFFCNSLNIELL